MITPLGFGHKHFVRTDGVPTRVRLLLETSGPSWMFIDLFVCADTWRFRQVCLIKGRS